ncbi:uncharacterized protein [Musca autumnalis]|uniref:uncharacterized protein n=1 Tax=Musca autumnalis TaxID=221902 RepID=UPI003CF7F47E
MQCYAPTEPDDEEIKDDFYRELEGAIANTPKGDILMILGDFNAKVGNDNTNLQHIMGKHALPSDRNDNEKLTKKQQYTEAEKQVKQFAKEDKNNFINVVAADAEIFARRNNLRGVYTAIKQITNKRPNIPPLKDKNGLPLTTIEHQLTRWTEFYKDADDNSTVQYQPTEQSRNSPPHNINVAPPTNEEISSAISKLKSHKAAGPDNLPPELFKYAADVLTTILQPIVSEAWCTNNIPSKWKEEIEDGIQWRPHEKLSDLDYADDICFTSHSIAGPRAKLEQLLQNAKTIGLKINMKKTKLMRLKTQNTSPLTVMVDSTPTVVDDVDSFCYLGSIITKDGGADTDVQSRINKARIAFHNMRKIWSSRNISRSTKLRLFNTSIKPILLYGCETWKVTKTINQALQDSTESIE